MGRVVNAPCKSSGGDEYEDALLNEKRFDQRSVALVQPRVVKSYAELERKTQIRVAHLRQSLVQLQATHYDYMYIY